MCYGYVCVCGYVCAHVCASLRTSARGCAGEGDILWLVPTQGLRAPRGTGASTAPSALESLSPPPCCPHPRHLHRAYLVLTAMFFCKAICCLILFIYLFICIDKPSTALLNVTREKLFLLSTPQKKKKSIMEKRLIPGARREQRNPPGSVLSPVLGISSFHREMV